MPFDPISYALAKNAMKYSKSIKPDWEVLAEVEVEADCDYVEFTGLDINSDKAYVIFMFVKNPTSSSCSYQIFINGDTTSTNYYKQYAKASGTSIAGDRTNDSIMATINAGATMVAVIYVMLDIDGYSRVIFIGNRQAPDSVEIIITNVAKNTTETNITSIRIAVDVAGGIGAGSKFILARVKRP